MTEGFETLQDFQRRSDGSQVFVLSSSHWANKASKEALIQDLITRLMADTQAELDRYPREVEQQSMFDTAFVNVLSKGRYVFSREERKRIRKRVYSELFGLGPLDAILENMAIRQITLTGKGRHKIIADTEITVSDRLFWDDDHLIRIKERVLHAYEVTDEPSNLTGTGYVREFRFQYIENSSVEGGWLLKFERIDSGASQLATLINSQTLSLDMLEFLRDAVENCKNILVIGPIGSGKTTILRLLAEFIPPEDRIVIIEQQSELSIELTNDVHLLIPPENGEVANITAEVIETALQMQSDRLVIDELDTTNTLHFLRSLTQGYSGSLGSCQLDSVGEFVQRITELSAATVSGRLDITIVEDLITSTVDLVVAVERLADGSRKIIHISQPIMREASLYLQPIFQFVHDGVNQQGQIEGSHERSVESG